MTTLAMGPLQLTIAFNPPHPVREVGEVHVADDTAIETAFESQRRHEAVEADRRNWATSRMLGD